MDNSTNQKVYEEIQSGVENNSSNSPQLSIDPDSDKIAVIGDPNETHPTNGDYSLTFRYYPEQLSEDSKQAMEFDEETGEYVWKRTFSNRRIKPLYRERASLIVAGLFSELGVITADGYDAAALSKNAGKILLENIDKVAELARIVCGIPSDQIEQLDPVGLANFLNQFLENEPNILKEAVVFLVQQSTQQKENLSEKAKPSQTPNIQQS